jgi:ribonucleoside-triphosphate reductase
MRFNKNEDIAMYLIVNHPELCEDDVLRPHDTICVRIPVKAPEGSILRTERALDLLERVKKFSKEWIESGHVKGDNMHNISATISVKNDEWESVGEWMWTNKNSYNGLSVLPYSEHSYAQPPFQDISKEEYEERISHLHSIDLTKVIELDDSVNFGAITACSGGMCEVHF